MAEQSLGKRVKRIVGWILVVWGAFYVALTFVGIGAAILQGDFDEFFEMLPLLLFLLVEHALFVYGGLRLLGIAKKPGKKTQADPGGPKVPQTPTLTLTPAASEPEEPAPAYSELMSGQLVALYKKSHDESYSDEYTRRLMSVGFSESEASSFFLYELMTLKHDAIERLADPSYLQNWYFDLRHVLLPEDEGNYIEHQTFLCSEIVKIWDEAEWHYWNSHEREMPSEVWEEIYRLSRYGGGKLFVDYLKSMAEHTGVNIDKVRAYSAAEQQLIFKYKWNREGNERHPYLA